MVCFFLNKKTIFLTFFFGECGGVHNVATTTPSPLSAFVDPSFFFVVVVSVQKKNERK